jgi:hypothetical protein
MIWICADTWTWTGMCNTSRANIARERTLRRQEDAASTELQLLTRGLPPGPDCQLSIEEHPLRLHAQPV